VPAHIDLPELEREIMAWWDEQGTFEASLKATADAPRWTFYEGPPTANGRPGTHHVEARVFKDVFPRFQTMRGKQVERKAGWDCHGLPVELAVEKEPRGGRVERRAGAPQAVRRRPRRLLLG